MALEFVYATLKRDKEIVLLAVKQNSDAFQFADESLQKDKEIALAALSVIPGEGFKHMHTIDSLRQDREVVIAAVKQCPEVLDRFVRGELRFDKDIKKIAEQAAVEFQKRCDAEEERENQQEKIKREALRQEIKRLRERRMNSGVAVVK
eukprot:TRINITY_DN1192_c0_g2_i1.p1 TRINITY_DN1192_c0_g2~~TRINITY_DN1192_c0_g2_i1.p1  ORF type:complete len:149 (-),score=56.51 TRINITY_DN1192_c0_g2_i1:1133-1579(-)